MDRTDNPVASVLMELINKAPAGQIPKITEILKKVNTESLSEEDYMERRCKWINDTEGDLEGYDCRICKNKGYIEIVSDGHLKSRDCECMKTRINLDMIAKSGLSDLLERYTFEKYETTEEWQKVVKSQALEFISGNTKGFFIGGAVGAGKSHICTAITGELMKRQKSAKYMMYRDESTLLKGLLNRDTADYDYRVGWLKRVDVLYIDDLFKSQKNAMPTEADIKLMFEIINSRYCDRTKITVISSEKRIDDLIEIDEATGSRIKELSGEYVIDLSNDGKKNWRLK